MFKFLNDVMGKVMDSDLYKVVLVIFRSIC